MQVVSTYKDFTDGESIKNQARELLRRATIAGLSIRKSINGTNWIKLPYYHHVFDDERGSFERQLKYLKNFGEFVSMDSVWEMVTGKLPINGRYFCVSFDDGFYNCYKNMMPITAALDIPVMIYLPTSYINLDVNNAADAERIKNFYPEKPMLVPFLNWEQCREMMKHKVSFGSHTVSHANLMTLSPQEIEKELRESKATIEHNLNTACEHFACPWGRAGLDFDPAITTAIASKLGYKSFATTNRGTMLRNDDMYQLKRDHIVPSWENFQLKYFFGQ